jgi:hypothetical protein
LEAVIGGISQRRGESILFFDRVNHDKLVEPVAKRAEDKRLKLIRPFLNAQVIEKRIGQSERWDRARRRDQIRPAKCL